MSSWKVYSDDKVVPVPEGFHDATVTFIPFRTGEILKDEVIKTGDRSGTPYVKALAKIVECEHGVGELAGFRLFPPQPGESERDSRSFQKHVKGILDLGDVETDLDVDPAEVEEAMRSHSYKARIKSKGKFVDVVELTERIERVEPQRMPRIEANGGGSTATPTPATPGGGGGEDDDDIPF